MTNFSRRSLLLIATCTVPTALRAQAGPPLITDRPDQTESAVVVPRGAFQLEVGGTHSDAGARTTNLGGALLRVGVAAPVEFRLGFAGWHVLAQDPANLSGFGDLDVGAKVVLTPGNGPSPAVAILGYVTLPVGHEAFGAGGLDPHVRAALAHELPGGFGLGYNVGATWTTETDQTGAESLRTDAIYTVTLGRSLAERLGAFVEGFGVWGLSAGRDSWHALDAGLTYALRPNLQLDVAAGLGLSDAAENWFVGGGISVRLPR
jgi:hypothetical protein